MRIFKTLVLAASIMNVAFAQEQTDPVQMKALEQKFRQQFEADKTRAEAIVKKTNQSLRMVHPDGQVMEFAGFTENGQMLYYKTDNQGSGKTISVNKVWPGGSNGTSLTGSGLPARLGEWDGGGVLLTHQEFSNRITQTDAASPTIEHATHVAGTMIAAGVDAAAKGMAYQATLKAHDWTNDDAEMVTAAGAGMLLSNHSYGTICGWYYNSTLARWEWYGDAAISATIDYKYGFYDQQAQGWDDIAYNNPYYLICKAAGNDRGSAHTGSHYVRDASNNWIASTATRNTVGPYDCVESTATAKNVLTVGAVNKIANGWTKVSDVVMSSFSGWGPTDDGRIKPDVVTAGVSIYSTTNTSNTAYATLDGTSMATPAATGALLLVQQHHFNLFGKFMRAATLKGLAIHTADEAGNAGPDYTYGWGLLNISKAVKHLTDSTLNQVYEKSLANGATFTKGVTSDGTKPLRITISWTDQAGVPVSPSLNPSNKMLITDLDIRLKRNSDNTVYSPYILNPALPAAVATTGDNIRDNVEQIYVAAPTAGSYTLTVSHKGALGATQAYSLLVSGEAGRPIVAFNSSVINACIGQAVTFNDLSSASPTSYKWYFPGGTPSTATTATPNVTYNASGKYPVALKVTNAIGSDSIYVTNYITVGSTSLPFIETFESNSTTLGLWNADNPDNDTTWVLRTVGGTSPGTTAASVNMYNYATQGARDGLISPTISLTGYSSLNLSFKHAYSRYFSSFDSIIVYLSNTCGASWTRVAAKGGPTLNTVTDDPGEFLPASASQWCGGSMASCFNVNLTPWIGSDVKIKIESYNGFGNNMYVDNVSINGTPLKPVASFGTSRLTVCAGELVDFYDSTQNPVTTWEWTFNGATATSSGVKNPTGIIYNTPGNYTVKLKTTNATGSDSMTRTNYISVLPALTAPAVTASGALTFCSGDSVTLTSDVANSYQWLKDGAAVNGATNRSYAPKAAGAYKVEIQNAAGCKAQSAASTIALNPKPVTSNITGSASSNFGKTESYSVTATTGSTYQWAITNGTQASGGTTNAIDVTWATAASGTVQVIETKTGCKGDAKTKTVTLTPNAGVAEPDVLSGLKVYPNPANAFVYVVFESTEKQQVEVNVLNILGQKMYGEKIGAFSGHYEQQINTGSLSKGVYFIEVKSDKGSRQVKVMIE